MIRVLSVFGTRPEGIKMAPVVRALEAAEGVENRVCITSQHREMLRQVLDLFEIVSDYDLDVMRSGQSLTDVTVDVLRRLEPVIAEFRPDWIVVQGDTTTAMTAALAGLYQKVRIGHVEAGLRTGNLLSPFPEEANRKLVGAIATAHWAPTEGARANLLREGIPSDAVLVTGNTVIDALHIVRERLECDPDLRARTDEKLPFVRSQDGKRLVLVTGHRRENFGHGMEELCRALAALSERGDVRIVYPVHLNPNVQEPVRRLLGGRPDVHLIEPMGYLPFARLLQIADIVITDSGGIQEEAPVFGKPVLVTRDTTERPEAIEAGVAQLVGADSVRIVEAASRLLDDARAYAEMANAVSPFGDGRASARIVQHLCSMT